MSLRTLHKNNHNGSRQKGFTLIELLIVMAIVAILGTAIYTFFTNISTKSTIERSISATQQKARLALEMMARDIRMTFLDPTGDASAGMWLGPATHNPLSKSIALDDDFYSFSADLNYDGDINDPFERIAYFINGDELIMATYLLRDGADETNYNAPVDPAILPMLTGVQDGDLQFRYFNQDNIQISASNAAANDGKNLYAVEISLTVRTPTAEGEIERTYNTMVRLRNKF